MAYVEILILYRDQFTSYKVLSVNNYDQFIKSYGLFVNN